MQEVDHNTIILSIKIIVYKFQQSFDQNLIVGIYYYTQLYHDCQLFSHTLIKMISHRTYLKTHPWQLMAADNSFIATARGKQRVAMVTGHTENGCAMVSAESA